VVRALEAVADRHLPAGEVDQGGRDEERADLAGPALLEEHRRVGDAVEAADAGADQHPGPVLLLLGLRLPARILDGLDRGGDAVDDELVVAPELLGVDIIGGAERALAVTLGNDAADLGGEIGDVEVLDGANTGPAGQEP
jgi:hypothetical protein